MNYSLIKLNTARNCLRYIVRAYNIKEIFIPYYLCASVRTSLKKENCKIIYYHINRSFEPEELPKNVYILYPNYFGICSDIVNKLVKKYKNLIIDNAHAFYEPPKGIASFYSLRKFFPYLQNGAFLYTSKIIDMTLHKDDYKYSSHLLNYKEICQNENRLDGEDIKIISDTTLNIFSDMDFESEQKQRLEKFQYFHNKYGNTNCLNINRNNIQSPFIYPYLLKTSNEAEHVVKELQNSGYVIYKYWHNLPDSFEEKIFYTNLVAIPLNAK